MITSETTEEAVDEIDEVIADLVREGEIIKTKEVRGGKPVYVDRDFATPEEIAEHEREQRAERGEREH